ncbi:MAG: RsmD family RNA methyltransferase [Chloroflexi bacterium]|nr:RsmD family RNA methyltransferase [Chloroflexota bacterium]
MRVIAGTARGRALRAPTSPGIRPTSDLIKGVIFSLLEAEAYKRGFEPDEEGALAAGVAWPRVLDLFAGSGALGIEALSRGATHADLVDADLNAVRAIEANLLATDLAERGMVFRLPIEAALQRLTGPYELVFADPPYDHGDGIARLVEGLARPGLVSSNGVVVLEQGGTAEPPPALGGLPLANSRRHGKTRVTAYWSREDATM